MTEPFSIKTWIDEEEKRNPGFKERMIESYNNPPRDIKSEPPVACRDGKYECHVPKTGMIWDGQIYRCKLCGKKFIHIILSRRIDGSWDHARSGWYLQSDSIWDIIKSWFKN